MPHIDEMLGVATLATAGMFAAIALRPIETGTPATTAQVHAPVAIAAATPHAAPSVCPPSIEPASPRGVERARIEREQVRAPECAPH